MSSFLSAVLLCLLGAGATSNASAEAEAANAGEAYLSALAGSGDDRARELLLGGVTIDAQISNLENWRVVSKDPFRAEEGDLKLAARLIGELDAAGHASAAKMMSDRPRGKGMIVQELSRADAEKLLAPTKQRAERLSKTYPLLAYVARVGKEAYWHPKNPIRALLAKAGRQGRYSLQLQRFKIETREGPQQVARTWPLRVLRFRTGAMDTGWRILPASDWNPE